MSDHVPASQSHEPHPWSDMTSAEVLATVVYEMYGPVSVLGLHVDRLASGTFEDEELIPLIAQMRDATNNLGRLVVSLKRYTAEHTDES